MIRAIVQTDQAWLLFERPRTVISAACLKDVVPALCDIESAVKRHGLHACGFIAYDAAPTFDPALKAHRNLNLPLLSFGLFETPKLVSESPEVWSGSYKFAPWKPALAESTYNGAFASIKDYIQGGHTYQVNYTFPFTSNFTGDSAAFFGQLIRAQRPRYGAFIETEDWTICSASPELFFGLNGDRLTSRPMKGTAPRGLTPVQDNRIGAQLRRCEKNRAENIMIVDMIRNDMGRIACTGSVTAKPLFTVERYPNVFQLTSTVHCRTNAPVSDIFKALFPCASITGAPKYRATEIIQELEPQPRGLYTGTVGYIAPNRQAQFNVAIRTVVIHKPTGAAQFGAGSGVVWDSQAHSEFAECLTKASVLSAEVPSFSILETIRWTPTEGWFLLDFHLNRMRNSARYFGFKFDREQIQRRLQSLAFSQTQRVRLLLSRTGEVEVQSCPMPDCETPSPRAALAAEPVNRNDPFLYHKTTHRNVYAKAKASRPGFENVLLWNESGEVTEAAIANVIYRLNSRLYTPPVRCGLLAGVFRAHLLSTGQVKERILRLCELSEVQQLYLANSVRGMWEIKLEK